MKSLKEDLKLVNNLEVKIDIICLKIWKWIWNNFSTRNFRFSMVECVVDEIIKDAKGKKLVLEVGNKKYDFEDYMIEFNEEIIYWK